MNYIWDARCSIRSHNYLQIVESGIKYLNRSHPKEKIEQLPLVRGQINFAKSIQHGSESHSKLVCQYSEEEIYEYIFQLVKELVSCLREFCSFNDVHKRADKILAALKGVTAVTPTRSSVLKLKNDRSKFYALGPKARDAIQSILALLEYCISSNGVISHFGFSVDMNFYYERLVDFVLKQLLEDRTNRKLLFQTKVHFLNNQIRNLQIVDNDEIYQGYFKLRPDIVVCDEKDRVRCIIDSKYKAQSDNGDLKIRAQDIVQMVGYWQHYQQSDGVSAKLLLIHPRVTATKATSNLFSQDGYVTLSAPRKDDLKIRVRIISMHIDNALQLVRSRKSKAA